MSDDESLGSWSERSGAADSDNSRRNSPPTEAFDPTSLREQKLVEDCDNVVAAYRSGTYTDLFAYGRLLLLCDEGGDAGRALFKSYLQQLRAIDDVPPCGIPARVPLSARISDRGRKRPAPRDDAERDWAMGSETDETGGSVHGARLGKRSRTEAADDAQTALALMPWTQKRKFSIAFL